MLKSIQAMALMFAISSSAQAGTYTLLVFESPDALAARADTGVAGHQYWSDYASFGQRLAEAGVLRGGAALQPEPQLSLKQAVLGGYFVIEVADRASAERWAADAPAGGKVLVTQSVDSPAMAAAKPAANP